jgi:hypothetical protein
MNHAHWFKASNSTRPLHIEVVRLPAPAPCSRSLLALSRYRPPPAAAHKLAKSSGKTCEMHGFLAIAMLPWQFSLFRPAIVPWPVQFPNTPAAAVVPDEVLGLMTLIMHVRWFMVSGSDERASVLHASAVGARAAARPTRVL